MENKENLATLEANLISIENNLKEVISSGLELIKTNPSIEKETITMFITPALRIYEYFIKETMRTGNESVGKNVMKYAMFKKI